MLTCRKSVPPWLRESCGKAFGAQARSPEASLMILLMSHCATCSLMPSLSHLRPCALGRELERLAGCPGTGNSVLLCREGHSKWADARNCSHLLG